MYIHIIMFINIYCMIKWKVHNTTYTYIWINNTPTHTIHMHNMPACICIHGYIAIDIEAVYAWDTISLDQLQLIIILAKVISNMHTAHAKYINIYIYIYLLYFAWADQRVQQFYNYHIV